MVHLTTNQDATLHYLEVKSMKLSGKLLLTEEMVLKFVLDHPLKVKGMEGGVVHLIYEVLPAILYHFKREEIIMVLSGDVVETTVEIHDNIGIPYDATLIAYV